MITERALREAIAECEGERDPGASTCVKLAAFYSIRDHLYPEAPARARPVPSMAYGDAGEISYSGGSSEFARLVDGRDASEVMPVMDELMDALMAVNPRLYSFAMRRLKNK